MEKTSRKLVFFIFFIFLSSIKSIALPILTVAILVTLWSCSNCAYFCSEIWFYLFNILSQILCWLFWCNI